MNPHKRHPLILVATVLVYIFLYAPILVLMLYSFNASKANITFEGFIPALSERVEMKGSMVQASPCGPFHWFCELSKNNDVLEAAGNTLTIAFTSTLVSNHRNHGCTCTSALRVQTKTLLAGLAPARAPARRGNR